MNKSEQDHIRKNKFKLVRSLEFNNDLLQFLEQEEHIGRADIEALRVVFKNEGNSAAISELLRILTGRPGSYASLIAAATALNQNEAVSILENLTGLKAAQPSHFPTPVTTTEPDHSSFNINPRPPLEQAPLFNVNDPQFQKILDFIVDEEPLDVVVEGRSHDAPPLQTDDRNSYILPPGQLRLALLLNTMDFNCPDWTRRDGSEKDLDYLSELLNQLGFEVHPKSKKQRLKENKTAEQVKSITKAFKDRCNEVSPSPSIAIIFIGSHGFHPNKIVTSDSGPENGLDLYEDIVREFYHENCPGLQGKPKVFLVQACQEYLRDRTDSLRQPKIADVLICTAGMPGDQVCRDPFKGSWFVYCFTYMMMKYAKDKPLQDILKMVKIMLENIKSQKGIEQVPVTTELKFDKNLFFIS